MICNPWKAYDLLTHRIQKLFVPNLFTHLFHKEFSSLLRIKFAVCNLISVCIKLFDEHSAICYSRMYFHLHDAMTLNILTETDKVLLNIIILSITGYLAARLFNMLFMVSANRLHVHVSPGLNWKTKNFVRATCIM